MSKNRVHSKGKLIACVIKLKQEATYYIRKEFKSLNSVYYNKNILWSNGYFANSIGNVSIETAKHYIDNQG